MKFEELKHGDYIHYKTTLGRLRIAYVIFGVHECPGFVTIQDVYDESVLNISASQYVRILNDSEMFECMISA